MAWVATKHLRRFANGFAAKVAELFAKKTDIHNGTLIIQRNGAAIKTFTANQMDDVTADITVPTRASELENDLAEATSTAKGLMGAGDKSKLDGIADRATANAPSQTVPKANGNAAAGTETGYARGDHVHPLQENATTATKLAEAKKINGVAFDGSKDITVADSTKVPLSGGKMAGELVMKNVRLTDGVHDVTVMVIYDDGDGDANYGSELLIGANGSLFIGSGESYKNLRAALQSAVGAGESYAKTSENAYFSADTILFFYSNCNTIANRKGLAFDGGGNLRPLVNEQLSLGTSAISWLNAFIKNITATSLTLKDGGQIRRPGKSGLWYQGRDLAMVRQNSAAVNQYLPVLSVKTESGSWEIGPYTGNILHLSYITDIDYNAKTNKQTADIQFLPDGSVKANVTGKVNGHTVEANVPAGAKFTDTTYSHPTSAGNKHIPSGGASGQILRWKANGEAQWGADNNTTYGAMKGATASAVGAAGLVPAPAKGANMKFLRGDGTWQEMLEATDAEIDSIIAGTYK